MDAATLGENENFGEGEEKSSRLSTRSIKKIAVFENNLMFSQTYICRSQNF